MLQKKVPLIDRKTKSSVSEANTNVILRYLLNDVPEQSKASSAL
jgi:hypothetical protein